MALQRSEVYYNDCFHLILEIISVLDANSGVADIVPLSLSHLIHITMGVTKCQINKIRKVIYLQQSR